MLQVMSMFKNNAADKGQIIKIPVDKIKPNPFQPRKHFDMTSLEELSSSIKQYGVLQPINVRRIGSGNYELIAGERRLRATQLANFKEIPAIVVDIDDNDSAIIALIENLQREDLNFLEEAEGYYHLIHEHGLTQEELALKVGKTQSTIANKLRLLKLSPKVQKIIIENNLTERHARALLRLPDEQMQLSVLKNICENNLNVKKTEELIQRIIDKTLNAESNKKEKKHIRAFKDIRIFINTLKQAVDMMRQSGIDAKESFVDKEEYIEYIIHIPKTKK
ncbi:MAG: nucleoid occlusion protein [Clostridiaceae bacterium]|nr:nucleoid occlusion protein [Clostridiaceae bacterium]